MLDADTICKIYTCESLPFGYHGVYFRVQLLLYHIYSRLKLSTFLLHLFRLL